MNLFLLAFPLALFLLLSLPQTLSDHLRAKVVFAFKPIQSAPPTTQLLAPQLENHQLRRQLDLVYQWIDSEKQLQEQKELFQLLQTDASLPKEMASRRIQEFKSLLQKQTLAAFAQIIHRDPASWSSSCWIDVGEENNKNFQLPVIAKNSPVVAGDSLVGVVEYVGRRQSRIRLITDAGLKVAVRAVRGAIQERETAHLTRKLIQSLQHNPRYQTTLEHLQNFYKTVPLHWRDEYLAKGELSGSSAPYFRSLHSRLKGVGFNADFPDLEGSAKDLRSLPPIVQTGDLLLTSGLDGIFPPGLKVASVEEVFPLARGSFTYELTASPTAGTLGELKGVFVLPPLE